MHYSVGDTWEIEVTSLVGTLALFEQRLCNNCTEL